MFTLGPTGQASTSGFFLGGGRNFANWRQKKKKKSPVRPLQRIFLENFQKTRHISLKKKKEFVRFRQ
jgi:hypothetical protein